jgi:hypothetical protein
MQAASAWHLVLRTLGLLLLMLAALVAALRLLRPLTRAAPGAVTLLMLARTLLWCPLRAVVAAGGMPLQRVVVVGGLECHPSALLQ